MSAGLRSYVRPDGRCLVRPQGAWTEIAAAEAAALSDELGLPVLAHLDSDAVDEQAILVAAGFVPTRRDVVAVLEVERALEALAGAEEPADLVLRSADEVDGERLRLLDDELRDDVPGTSGWRSTPAEFREHTFQDPAFDRSTYLVAVDRSGDEVGLVRIWMNPDGPRLGMLGVRRGRRRRGIASALLRRALLAVRAAGETGVETEYDVLNEASMRIAERLGARRVGLQVELAYEPRIGRFGIPAAEERSGAR